MKNILVAIFVVMVFPASAQQFVKGYTRKDGTYVQPYYRSSPDNTKTNNYSYPGNINPFTGKQAAGPLPALSIAPPTQDGRVNYYDSKGKLSLYTIPVERSSGVTVLECYDEKDQKMGFIHRIESGESYLYDLNYKLVKIIKE